MGFTREQLEKIISEAPEGAEYYTPGYAAEYRKITSGDSYYGFVDNEWVEAIDRWLSIERINKVFKLIELAEQLQEMKIQESKQAEIDNAAQQVGSLAKESERDIMGSAEWEVYHGESWLPCIRFGLDVFGNHAYQISDGEYKGEFNGSTEELYFRNPLTPEQKQQKIDEQNGELLFDIFEQIDFDMRNEPKSIWDNTTDEWKSLMIEAAKQIDFKGKLESI